MVSHKHAQIYTIIADTGRAHEHTGFWYIYGVLMRISGIVVSDKHAQIYTIIADTGRAHEHTGFWYIYGVLMRISYCGVS